MITKSDVIREAFEIGIVKGKVEQFHDNLLSLKELRNFKAHNSAKEKFVAG